MIQINMPPKKVTCGDILNLSEVKNKYVNGKWIHCETCDVNIRVHSQFSLTEWKTHTDGVKHNESTNSKVLKNCQNLTKFVPKKRLIEKTSQQSTAPHKKRNKIISCLGFYYGNDSDLLPIYVKYKKEDEMSKSVQILCNNGR